MSEKVWNVLRAESLPIYAGTPDIFNFLPSSLGRKTGKGGVTSESILFVGSFFKFADGTYDVKSFADNLHYLANNVTAYAEYFEWRRQPLPKAFEKLAAMAEDGGKFGGKVCRLCNCAQGRIGCNASNFEAE